MSVRLKLDWCSQKAALYACKHWHYSRSLPPPPRVLIGVWEDERFIGVVTFSRGASQNLLKPYGLTQLEGCELTRVAMRDHVTPVSRILAIAIAMLRKHAPGLRLIVSFADPNQGHHGGIYQAGNWIYTGTSAPSAKFKDRSGRIWHSRQVTVKGINTQYGQLRRTVLKSECEQIAQAGKHRYVMPLDTAMRERVAALKQAFPKARPKQAEAGAHPEPRRGSTDPGAPSPSSLCPA